MNKKLFWLRFLRIVLCVNVILIVGFSIFGSMRLYRYETSQYVFDPMIFGILLIPCLLFLAFTVVGIYHVSCRIGKYKRGELPVIEDDAVAAKKKAKRRKFLIFLGILLFVFLLCFIFHEIINRDVIAVKHIITDYVSIDADSLIDVYNNTFELSHIREENGERLLSFGFGTHSKLADVLAHAPELRDRINEYVRSSGLRDELDNVHIYIENHANWVVRLWTLSDRIVVGTDWYDLEKDGLTNKDVLSFCKDFEIIDLGGYWGSSLKFKEPIDKDFFADFTKLRELQMDDIDTKTTALMLNEATADLQERGVDVRLYYGRTLLGSEKEWER